VSALPERGALAELPLPWVLLDLYRSRFTGRLELTRGNTKKSFLLQEGAPVGSESSLPAERLCAVLEDSGVLERPQRESVDEHLRRKPGNEAAALLSLGLLEPKGLFAGLREQVRRRMVECFGWANGDFALARDSERRDDIQPLRVDPYRLVQDGLRTHWPPERLLAALQPKIERFARPAGRLGSIIRRLELDPTVERMIAGLNGSRTLGAAVGAALSSPSALAALWVIDAAGGLEYSDSARADADAAPEIEIEITRAAAAGPAALRPAKADGVPKAAGPEAEKMRAEVLDRLERLDSLDFYELLGVARDAPHGAIRKAYFLAAKRYHPDAIVRLGLQEIRTQAGEVFSKIAEANEVLSNPERRAAYDRSLEGGAEELDVRVVAQAETFYRKGEILIRMGDFRGALDYLKNAVQLYPDEAAYQRDLAWAYYKKSPPDLALALEHIQKARELEPSDPVVRFRMGVIERALS
jgi:tetratricopeptide (TPR) repeat protein